MPSLSREQKVLTQNLVCTLWHSHSWENWLCLLFAVNQKHTSAADKEGFLSWKRHPPKIWVLVLLPHRWAADFVQLTSLDLYKLGLHIPIWSISLCCALAFTLYNHSCGSAVKNPPAMREIWVWSLGWEDPLEKGKSTPSSIAAWRIPWTRLSDFHFLSPLIAESFLRCFLSTASQMWKHWEEIYGEISYSAKEDTFLWEELLQPGLSLKSQPLHKCKTTKHSTPPE